MITETVDAAPTFPDESEKPLIYNQGARAFYTWLIAFVLKLINVITQINETATTINTDAGSAAASSLLAQKWSSAAVDTDVAGVGTRSAYHWSLKAETDKNTTEGFKNSAALSATASNDAKVLAVTAKDEAVAVRDQIVANVTPDWTNIAYAKNIDVISLADGMKYRSKQAHTNNVDPSSDGLNWKQVDSNSLFFGDFPDEATLLLQDTTGVGAGWYATVSGGIGIYTKTYDWDTKNNKWVGTISANSPTYTLTPPADQTEQSRLVTKIAIEQYTTYSFVFKLSGVDVTNTTIYTFDTATGDLFVDLPSIADGGGTLTEPFTVEVTGFFIGKYLSSATITVTTLHDLADINNTVVYLTENATMTTAHLPVLNGVGISATPTLDLDLTTLTIVSATTQSITTAFNPAGKRKIYVGNGGKLEKRTITTVTFAIGNYTINFDGTALTSNVTVAKVPNNISATDLGATAVTGFETEQFETTIPVLVHDNLAIVGVDGSINNVLANAVSFIAGSVTIGANGSAITLSNGNLTATCTADLWANSNYYSSVPVASGELISEHTIEEISLGSIVIGICSNNTDQADWFLVNGYGYHSNGNKFIGVTGSAYGASFTTGDVIKRRYSFVTGELEFYKNGVSQGILATLTPSTVMYGATAMYYNTSSVTDTYNSYGVTYTVTVPAQTSNIALAYKTVDAFEITTTATSITTFTTTVGTCDVGQQVEFSTDNGLTRTTQTVTADNGAGTYTIAGNGNTITNVYLEGAFARTAQLALANSSRVIVSTRIENANIWSSGADTNITLSQSVPIGTILLVWNGTAFTEETTTVAGTVHATAVTTITAVHIKPTIPNIYSKFGLLDWVMQAFEKFVPSGLTHLDIIYQGIADDVVANPTGQATLENRIEFIGDDNTSTIIETATLI